MRPEMGAWKGTTLLIPILLLVYHFQAVAGQLPTISFLVSDYTVPEGGELQVCAVITNVPAGFSGVTANIQLGVSTADANDYDMNANSRVIFSAGDTSGTVRCTSPNISITQDSLPEGTEQFLISLQFSLSFNFGFLTLVTAIIDDDDDDPSVALSATTYQAAESEGLLTICASLSLFASEYPLGLTEPLTVDLATADDIAVSPSDYIPLSEELEFSSGSVNGDTLCRDIIVIDDSSLEAPENFTVMLSNLMFNGGFARIGTPPSAVVTIEDSSDVTITLQLGNDAPMEGVDEAVELCVIITGVNASEVDLDVSLSTANGLAGPDDYSPPAPFQVTFSAADISSGVAMQCLNITIEDDSDVECDHDFTVGIDSTSPMVSADLSANVTVTISDTVDVGTIDYQFQMDTYTVDERGGNIGVRLDILSPGNLFCDITVTLGTVDGTAVRDEDYSFTDPLTVVFPCFLTSTTANITIIDDSVLEETVASFNVTVLGSSVDGLPLDREAVVAITDYEELEITVEVDKGAPVEGVDLVVELCVVVSGINASETNLTVTLIATDGLAEGDVMIGRKKRFVNEDYITPDPFEVTFTVADISAGVMMQCLNITIDDDSGVECNHDFTVGIDSVSPAVSADLSSNVTVTIDDTIDVSTIVYDFAMTAYAVNEGDGVVGVGLEITSPAQLFCDITVTIGTEDGTAVLGEDYDAADPLTVTFPCGLISTIGNITILDDAVLEEIMTSFNVTVISSDVNGFPLGPEAAVTIIDNEDPQDLMITINSDMTVDEGAGAAVLCVDLDGLPSGGMEISVEVNISSMEDGADEGTDFTFPPSVTFPPTPNSTTQTQCFSVGIIDDDSFECQEDFVVVITPSTPNVTVGSPSSARVGITSNDNVTILLNSTSPQAEGDDLRVCLLIADDDIVRECDINVTLIVTNGTATGGSDFNAPVTLMLSLGRDESMTCEDITTVDDAILELDEEFSVSLHSSDPAEGVEFGMPSTASLTIVDDEDPSEVVVQFEQNRYTYSEGNSAASVCLELAALPAGGIEREIEITITTNNVTAVEGEDYSLANSVVTFPDTSIVGSTACATFNIINDSILELDQQFTAQLASSDPAGVTFSPPSSTTTVTIEDSENPTDLTVTIESNVTVNEDVGSVQLCVNLDDLPAGGMQISVEVFLAATENSAVEDLDFNSPPSNVTFPPTTSSTTQTMCFNVTITDDDIFECREDFLVLINGSIPMVTVGLPSTATVEIISNDDVSVSLRMPLSQNEGDDIEVCMDLSSEPSGGRECDVTATLSVTDGTATGGSDISVSMPLMLTLYSTETVVCGNITNIDDSILELDEEFTVALNNSDPAEGEGVVFGTPSSVTATINDDEDPSEVVVGFEQMEYTYSEGNTTARVCLELQGLPMGGTEREIAFIISTSDNTAVKGEDYNLTSSMVTFPDTSTVGDTACATFNIINDSILELNQQFSVHIIASVPPGVSYSVTYTTVTIEDNDSVMLSFSQTMVEHGEDDGMLSDVCVMLTADSPLQIEVSAELEVVDASKADNSSDYSAADMAITFPVGSSNGNLSCANISIMDDEAIEGDHTFTLGFGDLLAPGPAYVTIGSPAELTVIIHDNDDATLSFTTEGLLTIPEGASDSLCVQLSDIPSEGLECDVEVLFTTEFSNKADFMTDFYFPSRVFFNATTSHSYELQQCFNVNTVNDIVLEGNQSFSVVIAGSIPPLTIGNSSTVSVVITDDEGAEVGLEKTSYTVNEADGVQQVCIIFTQLGTDELECNVTVSLMAISQGKTVENEDFSPSNYTAVFAPGVVNNQSRACVDIGIVNDAVFESDHTFQITITSATPSNILIDESRMSSNVTINDDDAVNVAMAASQYTVGEGDMTGQVYVQLFAPEGIDCDVIVSLAQANGSKAVLGLDYNFPISTVMFPAGSLNGSTVSLSFDIVDDMTLEGSHNFSIGITAVGTPSGPDILLSVGSPEATEVVILDNDRATLGFEQVLFNVLENVSSVEVCIEISLPPGGISCDVGARLIVLSTPKAVEGIDFDVFGSLEVIFPSTETITGDTQCVNVSIEDDMVLEGEHIIQLQVALGTPEGQIDFSPSFSSIIIADNDVVLLAFTESEYTTSEDMATVNVCVEVMQGPTGGLECNISVTLGIQDGLKADRLTDYSSAEPLEVLFVAFVDGQGSTACTSIDIIDDNSLEGPHNFTVSLESFDIVGGTPDSARIFAESPSTATVVIQDNEDATVVLTSSEYYINEGDGTVTVCGILLDIPTGGLECAIEVALQAYDGVKAGTDYIGELVPGVLAFPTNSTSGTIQCAEFGIIDDNTLEGEHNFTVNISSTSPEISVDTPYEATVLIQDNDRATLGFVQTLFNVLENVSVVEVCVEISNIPSDGLECDIGARIIVLSTPKAVQGIDFEVSGSLELNFPYTGTVNGDEQCVNITIEDDMILEGQHIVQMQLALGSPEGLIDFNPSFSSVIIADNDDVVLAFTESEYLTSEDSGMVEVCVELMQAPSGGLECNISVTLGLQNGPKTERFVDYNSAEPLEVIFVTGTDGQGSTACRNITIIDDNSLEGEHNFTVFLEDFDIVAGAPDTARIFMGTPSSATVVIEDNEDATVSLTKSVYEVSEGNGTVAVCVSILDVPSEGLECEIEVMLESSNGLKAVAGQDFNAVSDPAVLVFTSNSSDGTQVCAEIEIIDDAALEGQHNFTVNISSTTPAISLGLPFDAVIVIEDNDVATVAMEQSSYMAEEGDEYLVVCVEISDVPAEGLECDVVVSLDTIDGTAGISIDYDLPVFEVIFSQSSTNGTTACANLTIIDNDILDCLRHFQVGVISNALVTVNIPNPADVYIIDNENATVSLQVNTTEVLENEGEGSVELCAILDDLPAGGLECNVTANLTTTDSTARVGYDYEATSMTIVIPAGSASGSLTCTDTPVTVLDDDIVEYPETFGIQLVSSVPVLYIGDPDSATVVIVDDDKVTVGLRMLEPDYGAVYTVYEGNVTVVCADLTGRLERPVNVSVNGYFIPIGQANDGNGKGKDFSIPSVVTFGDSASPFNTISGAEMCFNMSAIDDTVKEGDEYFRVLLSSEDADVCFCQDIALFRIVEDERDRVYASLKNSSLVVSESEGAVNVCVEIIGALQTEVTIIIETSEGSAEANADFLPVSEDLIFIGSLNITEQCLQVPILNDAYLEYLEEYFYINISSSLDCVSVVDNSKIVTIVDDDCAVISLESYQYTASEEGDDIISVCTGVQSGEIKRDVEVYVNVNGGLTSDDVIAQPSTLLMLTPTNSLFEQCVNISIVDDQIFEFTENITILLNTTDDYVKLFYDKATIYILDNDNATLELSMAEYVVNEAQGSANVCVALIGYVDRTVLATVFTVEGTAEAGFDYTDTSVDIVFATEGQLCIEIPINAADASLENDESFMVVLTTREDDVEIARQTAKVRIIDESTLTFGFVQQNYITAEEDIDGTGATVEVCVSAFTSGVPSLERDVVVSLSTAELTASGGEDYENILVSQSSIDLVFNMGGSRRKRLLSHEVDVECVNISIISDAFVEFDEELLLLLTTNDPDVILNPQSARLTILNNDNATVTLEQGNVTVSEEAGFVTVCAKLTEGELQRNISVTFLAMALSAYAPTDYVVPNGTVVEFLTGTVIGSIQCRNITIIDDPYLEDSLETFEVFLESAGPVVLVNTSILVSIVDDDSVTVSWDMTEYSFTEEYAYMDVCVNITDGLAERNVIVELASMNGTAEAGEDYEELNLAVVFSPGVYQVCVNVSILEDDNVENDETFSIKLTSSDQAVVTDVDNAMVTIVEDNDTIQFGFEEASYTVSEGAGSVQYHLVFWGWLEREIIITVSAVEGSAELGQDYEEPENTTIVLPAGIHGPIAFWRSVTIINDSVFENEETFVLTLTADDPSVVVFNESQAEVVINDDDTVTYSLQQDVYRVCESSALGSVIICIVQSDGQLGEGTAVSVELTTVDVGSEAQAVIDYTPVMRELTILAGSTVLPCVPVLITNDSVGEGCSDEVFGVNLTAISPRVTIDGGSSLVQIVDDDRSGDFSLSIVNNSPKVSGGNVTVDFVIEGACPEKIECTIDSLAPRDCTPDPSDGDSLISTFYQLPIRPRQYVITIEASSLCEDSTSLERRFRTDNSQQCSIHFINDGVTIDPGSMTATFEWEGTGPDAIIQVSAFECRLDTDIFVPCGQPNQSTTSTTIDISGLVPGEHMFTVRPTLVEQNAVNCIRRPGRAISFIVQ